MLESRYSKHTHKSKHTYANEDHAEGSVGKPDKYLIGLCCTSVSLRRVFPNRSESEGQLYVYSHSLNSASFEKDTHVTRRARLLVRPMSHSHVACPFLFLFWRGFFPLHESRTSSHSFPSAVHCVHKLTTSVSRHAQPARLLTDGHMITFCSPWPQTQMN